MVELNANGIYCPAGDFYIDPIRPVRRAVITHGHADHARPGSGSYLSTPATAQFVRYRLARERGFRADTAVQELPFGERIDIGSVRVSLHPAGHILGSAQVRIESAGGQVWVVSGDYKRDADASCEAFELVPCDTFVTEATFGSPTYRWPDPAAVVREIFTWWQEGIERRQPSVLFAYALGKSQRVLAELAKLAGERRAWLDLATMGPTNIYRDLGIELLPYEALPRARRGKADPVLEGALILAPPSTFGPGWARRLGDGMRTALVSGHATEIAARSPVHVSLLQKLHLRKKKLREYQRGFVLSDHADWPALLRTVRETGARRVRVTHGESATLVRRLREDGIEAEELR